MSDGRQICVCALSQHPDMWVIERDQIHTSWSPCCQINTFCQHICVTLSVLFSHSLSTQSIHCPQASHQSFLFFDLRPPISLFLCTPLGRECLKVPLSLWEWEQREYPLRCDNMMTVPLFFGDVAVSFFVSLNTHNKQRAPVHSNAYTFHPSLSPCVAWLHTDRWFEFEPCHRALISDMLWIYLTS